MPRRRSASTTSPRAVKGADKLILATDPDREGEAISWHVLEVLKQKKALKDQPVERVVFNAITKQAVTEAMKHPRRIDEALVDAYLARRALDYLVGFTLSPVLWRKLPGARSAGRVQSVALRLVCDRELEIEKFVPQRILVARRDARDAARRDLRSAPGRRRRQEDSSGSTSARAPRRKRSSRRSKPPPSPSPRSRRSRASATRRRRSPPRPCSRKRAASSALRPRIRCASRSGSMKASTSAARPSASSPICVPTACRSRGEAISAVRQRDRARLRHANTCRRRRAATRPRPRTRRRRTRPSARPTSPAGRARRKRFLDADQAKLYELIWLRTVASQMESAELERTTADITAKVAARAASSCAPPARW